jgi:hypothetical protein
VLRLAAAFIGIGSAVPTNWHLVKLWQAAALQKLPFYPARTSGSYYPVYFLSKLRINNGSCNFPSVLCGTLYGEDFAKLK